MSSTARLKRCYSKSVLFISCLFLIPVVIIADDVTRQKAYVDVHMHFYNQVMPEKQLGGDRQNRRRSRRGKRSQSERVPEFTEADFIECADSMIAEMDRYGVQKAVVMPQPRVAGQTGFYDYRQILPAIQKYPERLFLAGGGGNLNAMIHETEAVKVTREVKARFAKEALTIVKAGAKAFGELAVLHLSMNPKHVFEEAPADHPLFLLLADIAAKHGLPVDIHMEAIVRDTPTPDNLRKISKNNPEMLNANIPAFERLLEHNRNANIVWQHMGWDNVGQMTIPLLKEMLSKHPNLYLGYKVEERPYRIGTRDPMPNRMVNGNNVLRKDWKEFIEEYADRILVSADQFVGIPGKSREPPQYMEYTWPATEQLSTEARKKVAHDNAVRLYHIE